VSTGAGLSGLSMIASFVTAFGGLMRVSMQQMVV
jgi:hypothetical protein